MAKANVTLSDLHNQFGSLPEIMRKTYVNTLALREFIEERKTRFAVHLKNANDGSLEQARIPRNAVSGVFAVISNDEILQAAAAELMAIYLEEIDPEFKAAAAVIQPLLSAIEAKEAEGRARINELELARQRLHEAQALALAQHLTKAAEDPAVIEAMRALRKAGGDPEKEAALDSWHKRLRPLQSALRDAEDLARRQGFVTISEAPGVVTARRALEEVEKQRPE